MNAEMTFEQIEQHIKKTDLKQFELGGKMHFNPSDVATDPGGVLQKICSIFNKVKPVLLAIANFPLLPPWMRAPIKTFIDLMSIICPE